MHITLVISSLGAGGAEKVLSALANYLAKKYQVTIIMLAASDSEPFFPLCGSINLIQLGQTYEVGGLLERINKIVKRINSLRKAVKRAKPNLVISFVDIMNITTLIATFGLKIPIIISERIDPHFHEIPSFYKWLRLKFYPFCAHLVVQTKSAIKYFPKPFQKFTSIVANPVSRPEAQKTKYAKKIKNVVSVGRLDPQKGHITLIKAFATVAKNYGDLTLTIYGEGPERHKLTNLINTLEMNDRVYLPGTTKNIHDVLINADLFIFPSLYEGFPNALCEAMAIGLPVIASNCSGNVDIIEDDANGKLFPAGDHESLAKILSEYVTQPEKLSHFAVNAKKISDTCHSDKIFSQWQKIVEQALD